MLPSRPECVRLCVAQMTAAHDPRLPRLLWAGVVVGFATFAVAIALGASDRAWRAYLACFLFWVPLAPAGVLLSGLLHLTRGGWGWTLYRLAQSAVGFVPLGLVAMAGLLLGGSGTMPWAEYPLPHLASWHAPTSVAFRGLGVWLALTVGCLAFVGTALRRDLGLIAASAPELARGRIAARLIDGWQGEEAEVDRAGRRLRPAAAGVALLVAVALSVVGFDWIMPLGEHWRSAAIGLHVLVGSLYAAIAWLAVLHAVGGAGRGLDRLTGPSTLHDLGRLLLGFSMLTTYLFFSQLLPIWYGNLPVETGFVHARLGVEPWRTLGWFVLALGYLGPTVLLLSRWMKLAARRLAGVGAMVLIGMMAERFLWVAPSLPVGPTGRYWVELGVAIGFASAFGLTVTAFLRRTPWLPPGEAVPQPEEVS